MVEKNSRLVDIREKFNLSQIEAAAGMGIAPSMLAMLETGDRKGSDVTKVKVASFYDLPVGYLFFGDILTKSDNSKEASK